MRRITTGGRQYTIIINFIFVALFLTMLQSENKTKARQIKIRQRGAQRHKSNYRRGTIINTTCPCLRRVVQTKRKRSPHPSQICEDSASSPPQTPSRSLSCPVYLSSKVDGTNNYSMTSLVSTAPVLIGKKKGEPAVGSTHPACHCNWAY